MIVPRNLLRLAVATAPSRKALQHPRSGSLDVVGFYVAPPFLHLRFLDNFQPHSQVESPSSKLNPKLELSKLGRWPLVLERLRVDGRDFPIETFEENWIVIVEATPSVCFVLESL